MIILDDGVFFGPPCIIGSGLFPARLELPYSLLSIATTIEGSGFNGTFSRNSLHRTSECMLQLKK